MCDCRICIDKYEEKRKEEINKIKQAKKNKEFYVSPLITSPDRISELFMMALKDVLDNDNK